jgi:hypothetical protein
MTDERLDELMAQAKHSYRVPAEAPLDAMWERVEREHFDAPVAAGDGEWRLIDGVARRPLRTRGPSRWLMPAVGVAATLLIGVGIGRFTAPGTADGGDAADLASLPVARDATLPVANDVAEPLQRATSEYLDETVALLASLRRDVRTTGAPSNARFVAQATLLLGTTRLLIDSPAASDPRLRDLLEDLELVLAQVAKLRTEPRPEELTFITEAMDERAVVPRMRTVAASLSASGY